MVSTSCQRSTLPWARTARAAAACSAAMPDTLAVVAGVLLIGTINYALKLDRVSEVVLIIVTGSLLILSVVAPTITDALRRARHARRVRSAPLP